MSQGESIRACDVRFLPIISAYARTLGIVEEVDRLCGSKRGVSDGTIVLALILDALSGRSPLFRLPQAFAKLDTELLLDGIPGTPYSIPLGGSFGSGFPPMQYSDKLAFQSSYEIIIPKGPAGSFVETQDLKVVYSYPIV